MRDLAAAGVLPRRYQDQNADSAGRGLPKRVGLLGKDHQVGGFKGVSEGKHRRVDRLLL